MEEKKIGNPLDCLFTDAQSQIEPKSIATLLTPFLRINKETKRIIFTPEGMKAPATNKLILFILARKAMHMTGNADSEFVRPREIKEELGPNIPPGTIDAALKRLSEKGPLRGQDGKYFIPDFNFPQAEEIFRKIIER